MYPSNLPLTFGTGGGWGGGGEEGLATGGDRLSAPNLSVFQVNLDESPVLGPAAQPAYRNDAGPPWRHARRCRQLQGAERTTFRETQLS